MSGLTAEIITSNNNTLNTLVISETAREFQRQLNKHAIFNISINTVISYCICNALGSDKGFSDIVILASSVVTYIPSAT